MLVGQPNVGKSVIFGRLTGKYANVSNYPGTTVEITTGSTAIGDRRFTVIDTPGVNSLHPHSEDERVTRNILLDRRPDAIIQVAAAKNLSRALILTTQLLEFGLPLILCLNMSDEADQAGLEVRHEGTRVAAETFVTALQDRHLTDEKLFEHLLEVRHEELSRILGIEVIRTVAPEGEGLAALKKAVLAPRSGKKQVSFSPFFEERVGALSALLPEHSSSSRSLALMLLAGDPDLEEWAGCTYGDEALRKIRSIAAEVDGRFTRPTGMIILKTRQARVRTLTREVVRMGQGSQSPVAGLLGLPD